MTGNTSYNLKYTVIDNAGNTGTATNTATTKKPEKNPGGVITDIKTEEIIYIQDTGTLIKTNIGKTVEYDFTQKTVTFSETLSGGQTAYTGGVKGDWICYAESPEYFALVNVGDDLQLLGVNGYNNRRSGYSTRYVHRAT